MRSDAKQTNSSHSAFSQPKSRIACRHCYDIVIGGKGRTVLDDSGTLAITAWTCTRCGGVIEEIRIMVQDGKAAATSDSIRRGATALDRTTGAGCAPCTQELKWNNGVDGP